MSLATKYRPKTFKEVTEQSVIVETLQNELNNKTMKSAYLFVGKTGCGKSTVARILANSINANIIEIDVASNNSAEKMRELLDTVKQKPIMYDYNVVILDEFHAASSASVQSLLLTIENPPKYLIFILCTTEAEKVPKTIYNRCEVFEFTNISQKGIVNRLITICKKENFTYEKEALNIIAQISDGSMRQAITYLEQCKDITIESIKKFLLADSYDTYLNLCYAVCDKNIESIVSIIKAVNNIDKFVEQYFSFLLDIAVYTKTKNKNLVDVPLVYVDDFDNLSEKDVKILNDVLDDILELQYNGKNSPILKQLTIATLMERIK